MNFNHQNREDEEGDTRPVGLFQMVNSIAGQSVELANPAYPETGDEVLPPAMEKFLQDFATKMRLAADWN